MYLRRGYLLIAVLATWAFVSSAGGQKDVAEAVKWLQLPVLTADKGLTARVSEMMVEAHRARYHIAVEGLAQPAGTRRAFVVQNSQRLADKVRAHLDKHLAAQAETLHDVRDVDALTAAIHSGIRSAQKQIQGTPIRKLVYAPLPPALRTWRLRLYDWWRKWNGVSALRDWRALRLLQHDTQLQSLLAADLERYMAKLRDTIAESHSAAMEDVHITETVPTETHNRPRTWYFKHIAPRLRKVVH